MKKITKGAIAAGAAALLLAGGGGTFMSWNAEEESTKHEITAGSLKLGEAAGYWTLNNETVELSEVKIVPGDLLEFTQSVPFESTGGNINAELVVTEGGVEAVSEADATLVHQLENSMTISLEDENGAVERVGESNAYTVKGDTSGTLKLAAGFKFPEEEAGYDNESMGRAVNFTDMKIDFNQILSTSDE